MSDSPAPPPDESAKSSDPRSEEERFDEHQQLRLVTDTMSASVAWCSEELRFIWVSREYAKRSNLTPEQVNGRYIVDVLGEEAFAALRPHIARVLSGERVEYEVEASLSGGERRWYNVVYTPTLPGTGQPKGWVAVVTDINDRKALEHGLREEARRKDEFLAVLAHELRNPLAPIRNAMRILRLSQAPEESREWAHNVIERQVDLMVRLVDDLLDVARISRGKIELRSEDAELASIVERALETSRPVIEAAKHALLVHLPEEPLLVHADVTRLAQVLSNLLNNAAKYTREGGQIELAVARAGSEVLISIRDTGVGIPKHMLARIFDMFTQVDGSLHRAQGGLGIGLTIVKRLVEMHAGQVTVESEGPGQGSTFTVRLPLAVRAPEAASANAPSSAERAQRYGGLRVLVVDDNKDAAESLSMLLSLLGHDVRTTSDGPRALVEAQSHRPDLVLLDIGMPGMDGYQVAKCLREYPETRDAMIVALTGWGQKEDRRRSREAGFDVHLVKPPDLGEVERLIKKLQSQRR